MFKIFSGGTSALYSLICRHVKVSFLSNRQFADEALSTYKREHPPEKIHDSCVKRYLEKHKWLHTALLLLVLLGTCMVIGDGPLTPAIFVFSAVSRLELIIEHHQCEAEAILARSQANARELALLSQSLKETRGVELLDLPGIIEGAKDGKGRGRHMKK